MRLDVLTPGIVSGSRAQAIENIAVFVQVKPPPHLRGHSLGLRTEHVRE